jgi:YVTN family beta-propeller protein
MRLASVRALIVGGMGLLAGLSPVVADEQAGIAADGHRQRMSGEGLSVELRVEPLGGGGGVFANQDLAIAFHITDEAGNPVRGLDPAAWLDLHQSAQEAVSCKEKVRSYLGGLIAYQPQVNLSAWYILTLNDRPSVSVENPLLDLTYTRMLADIPLAGPGRDWALGSDVKRLFVTIPDAAEVAVIDADRWRLAATVETGHRPTETVLQADGRYLWVSVEAPDPDQGGIVAIDTETLEIAARIGAGTGPHDLALGDDDRYLAVTDAAGGSVTLVDARTLEARRTIGLGGHPVSVDHSPLSEAFYVSDSKAGTIAVIDPRREDVVARIPATPGIGMVRVSPDGRWGFVVNRERSVVHVFDTTTNQMRHSIPVGAEPDQVTITDGYAYVRLLGSDRINLIGLDTLESEGTPAVIDIPAGRQFPGASAAARSGANAISPIPEGGGVLITNPADGVIYYYMEGMNAPMGTFRTYGRQARAVMAADKGLRESAPGVYASAIRLPAPGRYDVAFLLDTPRVVHCFDVVVLPDPAAASPVEVAGPSIEFLVDDRDVRTGEDLDLRFRLSSGSTPVAGNVDDVRVLAVLVPGIWQRRIPADAIGDGEFRVPLSLPRKGLYYLYVEAPSLGVEYRELPYLVLRAQNADRAEHRDPLPALAHSDD